MLEGLIAEGLLGRSMLEEDLELLECRLESDFFYGREEEEEEVEQRRWM